MTALFYKPENSRDLYFQLNNAFQICRPDEKSKQSKYSGLYAIYKNDICYYVGMSRNIPSRIAQHISGKYEEFDVIYVFLPQSNGYQDFFERSLESQKLILENNEKALIKELKPIENLLLPDDDFELDENKYFDMFNYKSDGETYHLTYSDISIHNGDDICVTEGSYVSDISNKAFHEAIEETITIREWLEKNNGKS